MNVDETTDSGDLDTEQQDAARAPAPEPTDAVAFEATGDGAAKADAEAQIAPHVEPPDELEALRREVAGLRDQRLRLLAEARNQQQRTQREKAESLKYAEADFARELLVVLDDLERTQQSAQAAADAKAVAAGVRIVYEHFLKVLKQRDIEPIAALGRPFDPSLHQAMLQQPSAEHATGIIMHELARGYKMHDRVLRPTRVIVSSGPPAASADEPAEAEGEGEKE